LINLRTLLISICLVLPLLLSGCLEEQTTASLSTTLEKLPRDHPSILPDWYDGDYHDYSATTKLLNTLETTYPHIVNVFSIGKSVLNRDIWCIRITNENNPNTKLSCLIDGCIHGCEWEAGEACLYLSEYLVINFERNETITNILNTTEVYLIPLINPDGRQVDFRFNENGVDLNRNFDVDFGRIRGSVMRLGRILGKKYPYIMFERLHSMFSWWPLFLTNCGRRPFTEPETYALSEFMKELNYKDFSFYLNCHTAVHNFDIPWNCFKPPFEMTSQEEEVFRAAIDWVVEHTEYEDAEMNLGGYIYKSSGTAMDYVFNEFRIPSFTFELLNPDFEPRAGGGIHEDLVHWMKTTIPVFMFLLVNIENFHNWKLPDIHPLLPEGVPPEPFDIKSTVAMFYD
jgi:hypothetical protein